MLALRSYLLDEKSIEILKKIKENSGISQSDALRKLIHAYGEELLNNHDDQMQEVPAL